MGAIGYHGSPSDPSHLPSMTSNPFARFRRWALPRGFRAKTPGQASAPRGDRNPRERQTVLIHIGKCGGESLKAALRDSGLAERMLMVHIEQPAYRGDHEYIIVARNPLRRMISAFNWRYKLVVLDGTQMDRFPGELDVLRRYGSIDALGEALYDDDGRPEIPALADARRIHHIREDIGFYLTHLLDRCDPGQIRAVLLQERLDADIERVFGIRNAHRINENHATRDDGRLSPRARRNLMRFLHRDYEALARLYAWGKIERKAYLRAIV